MLILASASPRRRELLRLIAGEFSVVAGDVDESFPRRLSPREAVEALARRKARAVAEVRPQDTVIGADTVVAVDGRVLGKPADEAEAADMLRLLSGRAHEVFTGVAVCRGDVCDVFSERTVVHFTPLTDSQIMGYVATGEPMDKAGAYGIQGRAAAFIPRIEGDYWNVVGLPVCRLAQLFARLGLDTDG